MKSRHFNSTVVRMLLVTSKVIFIGVAIVLCATTIAAPADCPTISVACPADGDTLQFTATVTPANPDLKLTYQWTVSRGEIKSGQGTPQITVDAERNGKGLGATVEVSGLPAKCPNNASCYRTHF
jgi:hypothetical protein